MVAGTTAAHVAQYLQKLPTILGQGQDWGVVSPDLRKLMKGRDLLPHITCDSLGT